MGRGGLVTEPRAHRRVLEEVLEQCRLQGLPAAGLMPSPIRGGDGNIEYLAWLLKRFNGDLTLAAAGYNAGEGAVQRHGGVPPYAETQRYVVRVGTLAERYRGQVASR